MKQMPPSSQARPAARPALSDAVVVHVALLTVTEAADVLRCSAKSVRRLITEGRLPAIKIAGSRLIRIEQTAIERLLEPLGPVAADLDLGAFIAGGGA